MNEARDAARTAFNRTRREHPPLPESAKVFLGHLQDTSADIGFPIDKGVSENIAFAILNQEAPKEQRKVSMHAAIADIRNSVLVHALPKLGIDGETIAQRAQTISDTFAESVVDAAAMYPQRPKAGSLAEDTLKLLNPNQALLEDRVVSACAFFDFFEPYLVDRLLDLDMYNPDKLKVQVEGLKRESKLLSDFYRSISHAIEFAAEGQSSVPMDDLIERMFQIGPIFVKLVQGLDVPDLLAGKIPAAEKQEFISNLSKGMQEGVMPPSAKQQQEIAASLPDGLSLKELVSSASIAHIVQTETPEGDVRATKVKRPDIDQKIIDNEDIFNLISAISSRFIGEHVGGTAMGERVKQAQAVLPFLLRSYVLDLRQELDFPKETAAQRKAATMFERHKGVRVPKIDEEYTDLEHITMEYVKGIRLEDLPADARHLENLFIFALESWKSGFIHGDAHGGNLKAGENGSIIAYDWGKSIELPSDFVKNMGRFLFAAVRRNPEALAEAYVKIQSPDHVQISEEEAQQIAEEVIAFRDEMGDSKSKNALGRLKTGGRELHKTIRDLTMAVGLRHQSTMDTRYLTVLQTALRYGGVVSQELQKYDDPKVKRKVLRQSIGAAIKEVYFSKPKEKNISFDA